MSTQRTFSDPRAGFTWYASYMLRSHPNRGTSHGLPLWAVPNPLVADVVTTNPGRAASPGSAFGNGAGCVWVYPGDKDHKPGDDVGPIHRKGKLYNRSPATMVARDAAGRAPDPQCQVSRPGGTRSFAVGFVVAGLSTGSGTIHFFSRFGVENECFVVLGKSRGNIKPRPQ